MLDSGHGQARSRAEMQPQIASATIKQDATTNAPKRQPSQSAVTSSDAIAGASLLVQGRGPLHQPGGEEVLLHAPSGI